MKCKNNEDKKCENNDNMKIKDMKRLITRRKGKKNLFDNFHNSYCPILITVLQKSAFMHTNQFLHVKRKINYTLNN
jgi:hypothetical protein